MKNKLLYTLLALVSVIVVTPKLVGWSVESNIKSSPVLYDQFGFITAKIESYQSGWFASSFKLNIQLRHDQVMVLPRKFLSKAYLKKPVSITLDCQSAHGPWHFGKLSVDLFTKSNILCSYRNKPAIKTKLVFFGQNKMVFADTESKIVQGDSEFSFSIKNSFVNFKNNNLSGKYQFLFPLIKLQYKDKVITLDRYLIKGNMDKMISDLPIGDGSLQFDRITAQDGNEVVTLIDKLRGDINVKITDSLSTLAIMFSLQKVQHKQFEFGKMKCTMSMGDFKTTPLFTYFKKINELSKYNINPKEHQAKMTQVMMQYFPPILIGSPMVKIEKCSVATDKGTINMNFRAGLDNNSLTLSIFTFKKVFTEKGVIEFSVFGDRTAIVEYLKPLYLNFRKSAMTSNNSDKNFPEKFEDMIAQWINKGFVSQVEGTLRTDIKYQYPDLKVNGKVIKLQE